MKESLLLLKDLLDFKRSNLTDNSENVYFNVLNDVAGEYNNKYHKTIKMKSIDVKSDFFAK